MAKVRAQVAGGGIQEKEATTVADLANQIKAQGYIATVNGEPQESSYALKDAEYVSFAKPVKAG